MAKFPANDIITLLDADLPLNLGESTSQDLVLGELMDEALLAEMRTLRLGYSSSRGRDDLRAAIAADAGVTADEVLITTGAAGSLFLTLFTCCEPGDEVVVTAPQFPPTVDMIAALGCTARMLHLDFDRRYRINNDDLDRLRTVLSDKTRLVIVATPQNPSGVIIAPEELKAMAAVVGEVCPNAQLLVDETYREAVYLGNSAPPSASTFLPRAMVTSSLSKAWGAPGLRIGWLICREPALMQHMLQAKMNVVISCPVVDELLALHVLRNRERILSQRQQLLRQALELVEAWIARHRDQVEWVPPDGGALCCVRLREDAFDDDAVAGFYRALADHQAMVGRGPWFYESDRVFRLGFGYLPLAQLKDALEALSRALHDVV